MADFVALKREFDDYKELATERQKLYDKFWKERLTWISILVASWTVTVMAVLHII